MGMTRRGFLTAAGAAAASAAAGTGTDGAERLAKWRRGHFQVHFIHTGVGESVFMVFPDSTTMLLDCGDQAAMTRLGLAVPVVPDASRLAGDWIARYVLRVNPNGDRVDYIESSHLHADHIGTPTWQSHAPPWDYLGSRGRNRGNWDYCRSGFGLAAEHLRFGKAIDRGYPDYPDPVRFADGPDMELRHLSSIYRWLAKRDGLTVEAARLGDSTQIRPLRDPASVRDFRVDVFAANGRILRKDGTVHDCYAGIDRSAVGRVNENGVSIGHVFTYGKFRFYTAGDLCDNGRYKGMSAPANVELEAAKALGHVSVAKTNHHAHYNSMPRELVAALSPQVWVTCAWDVLHAVRPVMRVLSDRSVYPGDRLNVPTVLPDCRLREDRDEPWLNDVPAEVRGKGAHVVVDVPPGGETYSLTFVDPTDEEMRVLGRRSFVTSA